MVARVLLVILFVSILGAATYAARQGIWGESSAVISTRTGSPGGGYGLGGRGAK